MREMEVERLLTFMFLFLSRAIDRTAGPILTLDGSFEADFANEMPFAEAKTTIAILGSNFPQIFSSLHKHENVE